MPSASPEPAMLWKATPTQTPAALKTGPPELPLFEEEFLRLRERVREREMKKKSLLHSLTFPSIFLFYLLIAASICTPRSSVEPWE